MSNISKITDKTNVFSEKNKKIIGKFANDMLAQSLSIPRILKLLWQLKQIEGILKKPLEKATNEDLKRVVINIEDRDYKDWTKHDYKVTLSKFYKWLYKCEEGEKPEVMKGIKTSMKNGLHRLPSEILTEEDIIGLLNGTNKPKEKALISVLYESGCRIGELSLLKMKNINFDKYGSQILISGKTGDRRVRLISSTPYLSNWLELHTDRENPEAYVWIAKNSKEPMGNSSIRDMIQTIANKINLKKKVNPHAFRHARATNLANKLTDAQMKEVFGWTKNSDMASVYVHLSGRDVDTALLKANGIKLEGEDKEENKLKPKVCERCRSKNPATSKFCNRCSMALDIETAMVLEKEAEPYDKAMNEALIEAIKTNPEFIKTLRKSMKKAGIKA
jgi:site-specific recombinase XerD